MFFGPRCQNWEYQANQGCCTGRCDLASFSWKRTALDRPRPRGASLRPPPPRRRSPFLAPEPGDHLAPCTVSPPTPGRPRRGRARRAAPAVAKWTKRACFCGGADALAAFSAATAKSGRSRGEVGPALAARNDRVAQPGALGAGGAQSREIDKTGMLLLRSRCARSVQRGDREVGPKSGRSRTHFGCQNPLACERTCV